MISPITWLWNIRHRKLIEETRRLINFRWFLVHDCGFKWAEKLPVKDLKMILGALKFDSNTKSFSL